MSWFTESNRQKHFIYVIPISFVFTALFGIGLGVGMEFKDKEWGGRWDNLDLLSTILGSIVGQIFQILLIWVLIC